MTARLLVLAFVLVQFAPTPPSNVKVRPKPGLPTVTWTKQSNGVDTPGWNSYTSLHFDPISGQVLAYLIAPTASGIYSTDLYAYDTAGNVWTRLGGTRTASSTCNDGSASDVQPWPPDRHPVQQMAVDTLRGRLWLLNGVCANVEKNDFWYLTLNTNPLADRWTKVMLPVVPSVRVSGAMVYSPDDDVLVLTGANSISVFHETWVYCPAATLSAKQVAAGCSSPQVWTKLFPAVQPGPSFSQFPNTRYDSVRKKLLQFGWNTNEVWDYDIPTQTWTNRNANVPADHESCCPEQSIAYLLTGNWAGKVLYHQTAHSNSTSFAKDWLYDPATATFTALTSVGGGPDKIVYLTWDPLRQRVVAESYNPSGATDIWTAVLQ